MSPYRRRLYQVIFLAAAFYNLSVSALALARPEVVIDIFGVIVDSDFAKARLILSAVMVVSGLAYAVAAFRIDVAKWIIGFGLVGKLWGIVYWIENVGGHQWPIETFPLLVFDDLVWILPFTLFMVDGFKLGERMRSWAPWFCAGIHLMAAAVTLFVLKPGTELQPDEVLRAAYITEHLGVWRASWLFWMVSAIAVNAFYCWWGSKLMSWRWGVAALVITCLANVFDLVAESLFATWLPGRMDVQRMGSISTGGIANGLYTGAGIVLMIATPALTPLLKILGWGVWVAGIGLTVFAFIDNAMGMAVTTGAVMALFCPFVILLGRKLK